MPGAHGKKYIIMGSTFRAPSVYLSHVNATIKEVRGWAIRIHRGDMVARSAISRSGHGFVATARKIAGGTRATGVQHKLVSSE